MKLTVSKSKNSASFYVQKSIRKANGSVTTITVEKLGNIDTKQTNVFEAFDTFMRDERKVAFCNLIDEERLKEEVARKVIDNYEFTGKFDEDLVKEVFKDELKFLEKIEKVEDIKQKIEEIFERFTY